MKLIYDKNGIYIFRSFCWIFNLFSLLLICISARLYFFEHNTKNALICMMVALLFTYLGTVYCKITFDLNEGYVHCSYFRFFRLKRHEFAIKDISNITADVVHVRHNMGSRGTGRSTKTALSIQTRLPDDNTLSFQLGTNEAMLRKSVEVMNSLLDQYRQNH